MSCVCQCVCVCVWGGCQCGCMSVCVTEWGGGGGGVPLGGVPMRIIIITDHLNNYNSCFDGATDSTHTVTDRDLILTQLPEISSLVSSRCESVLHVCLPRLNKRSLTPSPAPTRPQRKWATAWAVHIQVTATHGAGTHARHAHVTDGCRFSDSVTDWYTDTAIVSSHKSSIYVLLFVSGFYFNLFYLLDKHMLK